jgi:hypothetical protein
MHSAILDSVDSGPKFRGIAHVTNGPTEAVNNFIIELKTISLTPFWAARQAPFFPPAGLSRK